MVTPVVLPKLDHYPLASWVTIPGTPATCTSDGLTEGKECHLCEDVMVTQVVLPKLDHILEWSESESYPSTTTVQGVDVFRCEQFEQCGYEVRTLLPLLPPAAPVTPGVTVVPAAVRRAPAGDTGGLGVDDDQQIWGDIVTNRDWVIQDNYVDIGVFNGVDVFRVTALPNSETGQYELRYLLITQELLADMLERGIEELWFEMDGASLRIPISVFTSDATRQMVEGYGFDPDTVLFVLKIEPDRDGQEVEGGGKAYNVGLFIRQDGVQEYVYPDLLDIGDELGNPIRLMPR